MKENATFETRKVKLSDLQLNTGQVVGLPKNPRFIRDDNFEKLVRSVKEAPEMLEARPLVCYDFDGQLIVIMGNMRLRAMREIGITETFAKVLPMGTPVEKLREYTIKDNIAFGQNDWDILANEWDTEELEAWGMDVDFLNDDGGSWDNLDYISDEQKKPELEKPLKIEVVIAVDHKDSEEEVREAIKEAIKDFEGCEIK